MSPFQSWLGPLGTIVLARLGNTGISWSLSVVATNRLRRWECRVPKPMRVKSRRADGQRFLGCQDYGPSGGCRATEILDWRERTTEGTGTYRLRQDATRWQAKRDRGRQG